jgi:hypothetical protein
MTVLLYPIPGNLLKLRDMYITEAQDRQKLKKLSKATYTVASYF